MQIQKKRDGNKKQTNKTVLRLGQGKELSGGWEVRSMGATVVCETRTDKDLMR